MKNVKAFVISLLISLGIGALSGFLTRNSMELYNQLIIPKYAPPGFVFPVVWTILYTLMGISAYLVFISNSPYKKKALLMYALQLMLNFIWPIIFFNLKMYFPAFFVLLLLLITIVLMIKRFYRVNKTAAFLQIPYLLWILFATYLNFEIAMFN
ncbi:TspO/MBR family protein [Clostridium aminobutyricum]|uniref:Tryptophan-rich sensory protein n=1 Tax=Clostridium aminobutyricum TaxID=33953 RepID=A0A939DC00_CLOAM|nr:TspO/MBR family protein [Clostridium aminobutyricum]MBN7774468.1 tryptophan-rich sensory protein [Clostridium aminobutyricum]